MHPHRPGSAAARRAETGLLDYVQRRPVLDYVLDSLPETGVLDYAQGCMTAAAILISFIIAQQGAVDMASKVDHVVAARADLQRCFREQVVRLGRGNQESADTVLRATRSLCAPADADLVQAYVAIYLPIGLQQRNLRQDRTTAEDAAVAALLEARAR